MNDMSELKDLIARTAQAKRDHLSAGTLGWRFASGRQSGRSL